MRRYSFDNCRTGRIGGARGRHGKDLTLSVPHRVVYRLGRHETGSVIRDASRREGKLGLAFDTAETS